MSFKHSSGLTQLAADTGLTVDSQTNSLFGYKNGYSVLLTPINNYQFALNTSVCQGGDVPDVKALREAVKGSKALAGCSVRRYKASYTIKGGMGKAKTNQNVAQALDDLTRFLPENGFQNCCQSCGRSGQTDAYSVSGTGQLLCEACFAESSNALDQKAQSQDRRGENVIAGVVGAFLGALIGGALIVILGQLGYVAAISGLVMGVCTIKGYELLGGRLSTKGIAISIILMVFMVYLSNRMDWALQIASVFEAGMFESFRAVPYFQSEGGLPGYVSGLVILYAFTALGALPTIVSLVRGRANENVTRKMSASN